MALSATVLASDTTIRNSGFNGMLSTLSELRERQIDAVVEARTIRANDGRIELPDLPTGPVGTPFGARHLSGMPLLPTSVFLSGIASGLDIPVKYLRRMHRYAPDLFDANVNYWLQDGEAQLLIRAYSGDQAGVARAFLSNSYRIIDNYDVLVHALAAFGDAGVTPTIERCDLTSERMYVSLTVPGVTVEAPTLLRDYRAPRGGSGNDLPVVAAGLKITNSDVGQGGFIITPWAKVLVCSNGMTFTAYASRRNHRGHRMEEGLVLNDARVVKAHLNLIGEEVRAAVKEYLHTDFLSARVTELEELAGTRLPAAADTIRLITTQADYSKELAEAVVQRFIEGGQVTAGGYLNALTSLAQELPDAATAHAIEADAPGLMAQAARYALTA
ncbi:hypothetical protein AB0I28_32915 [Phytomonospora sp. NPDC050363]|uniref:hypothetical protein n=1 Tax=Phytomonospora sp. NPDC050363 TaxID=3155642 RepID=UPI0034029DAA